jgi:hypothetical protein
MTLLLGVLTSEVGAVRLGRSLGSKHQRRRSTGGGPPGERGDEVGKDKRT